MTRLSILARIGAALAAVVGCPGCLKRAEVRHVGDKWWHLGLLLPAKDEWFVCANGHRVAQVLEDFETGQIGWDTKVGNFASGIDEPKHGTPLDDLVCFCGAPWGYLVLERFWLKHGWPG